MTAHISPTDLHVLDAEPRILDLRLAEALGFVHPLNIRKLIRRNSAELAQHGEVFSTVAKTSDPQRGGRPGAEYWLNEPQSVLLCMFARTARGAEVRKEIIEVFIGWRRSHAFPALQPPEQPAPAEAGGDLLSDAPLAARVDAVRLGARLWGVARARAMWRAFGLPAVPPAPLDGRAEAEACLLRLLDHAPAGGGGRTVRLLVEDALEDDETARLLLLGLGIRVRADIDDGFLVANRHPGLAALYAGSDWSDGLWPRVLRRLPGAVPVGPMKYDGRAARGTLLPAALLDLYSEQ